MTTTVTKTMTTIKTMAFTNTFEEARELVVGEDSDGNIAEDASVVIVNGVPYVPNLMIEDPNNNIEAIKRVVVLLLSAADKYNNNNSNNDNQNDDQEQQILSAMKVVPVTGGNTNLLFRVTGLPNSWKKSNATDSDDADSNDDAAAAAAAAAENDPESGGILVRLFGAPGLIDRDLETGIYAALAHQGLALGYFGRFGNGRLEEWCPWPTVLTMTERDMAHPQLSHDIAIQLAKLHYQFDVKQCGQPLPTDKLFLWAQLDDWLDSATELMTSKKFLTLHDNERVQSLQPSLPDLQAELQWLKNDVINESSAEPGKIGFCHNDLLASNILWNGQLDNDSRDELHVMLIDFEYGGWNYFYYDIANHFNEFAGGTSAEDNATADYTQFPSKDMQKAFCKTYLEEKARVLQLSVEVDNKAVQTLYEEIQSFLLANHLVWALWAINSAATKGCEGFDYLKYAKCRLERYMYDKKREYGEGK